MTSRRVVAYVPDLMDRSRFGAVEAVEVEISFVKSPAEIVPAAIDADLVVLDVGRPGVIEALEQLREVDTIGFVSHVDSETIAAAKDAGIGQVLPRSQFFSQIVMLLS